MKKILKLFAAGSLAISMAACSSSSSSSTESDAGDETEKTSETDKLTGTYSINVNGDDWGCGVDVAVLELNKTIDAVSADDFIVMEHKQTTDWTAEDFPVVEVDLERTVTDAYLSDANGEKTDAASKYVTIEMDISPTEGSPLLYSMATSFNTWSDLYELTVSLKEGKTLTSEGVEITEMTVTGEPANVTTEADAFKDAVYESTDGYSINYATWTPDEASTTLFVWLHGMGEGGSAQVSGTDWRIPILANEVTNYIGEEFQSTVGGANVLVPQAPTYWMDTTGKADDTENRLSAADGTSAYTESLHELINKVKEETGSEKVVIAGCSNGGYMTMVMAMNYGDEYTAYVPICEAVNDVDITDEQIEELAKLPIYFVWAETDTTVDPTTHEVPTVERLRKAGATELVISVTEDVRDTTGRFTGEDGDPYEYNGHWSWIFFHNGESVSEDGVDAWEWIAEQISK